SEKGRAVPGGLRVCGVCFTYRARGKIVISGGSPPKKIDPRTRRAQKPQTHNPHHHQRRPDPSLLSPPAAGPLPRPAGFSRHVILFSLFSLRSRYSRRARVTWRCSSRGVGLLSRRAVSLGAIKLLVQR